MEQKKEQDSNLLDINDEIKKAQMSKDFYKDLTPIQIEDLITVDSLKMMDL